MVDEEDEGEEDLNMMLNADCDSDTYNDDYDVIVSTGACSKKQLQPVGNQQRLFYHSDHELRQSRDSSLDTHLVKLKLNASCGAASSNTLSADSGLVGTGTTTATASTNSDLESEKSAYVRTNACSQNLNSNNFLSTALASVASNAASVLTQINKHLTGQTQQQQQQQQLKRQKRMLYLNSNSNSTEQQESQQEAQETAKADFFYTRKINKKLIDSSSLDSILISDKNSQAWVIKLFDL